MHLHAGGWSGSRESGEPHSQGRRAMDVGTPRPSKCLPAMTKSASGKRVVKAAGTAVIHAEAGPLAALLMRAASRSPSAVSTSHSARKAAPARSPTSREMVV